MKSLRLGDFTYKTKIKRSLSCHKYLSFRFDSFSFTSFYVVLFRFDSSPFVRFVSFVSFSVFRHKSETIIYNIIICTATGHFKRLDKLYSNSTSRPMLMNGPTARAQFAFYSPSGEVHVFRLTWSWVSTPRSLPPLNSLHLLKMH